VKSREQPLAENEQASWLLDDILIGPSAWWMTRLRHTPSAFTAATVEELFARMRTTLEHSPADAVRITELAIHIANEVGITGDSWDSVMTLRGRAAIDHAYALVFVGSATVAFGVATRARQLFDRVVSPEHDLARLDLVESKIYERMERLHEALGRARRAAGTFLRLGDRSQFAAAKIHEGALLYSLDRPQEALDVWLSIQDDPVLDGVSRVRLMHNIALCHNALGHPEVALPAFLRCAAEFEILGMETERNRSRWCGTDVLIAMGRNRDAIPILREVWQEFERLGVIVDAALAALDLVEQLFAIDEPSEVPAICRTLVDRFTRAGMPKRAITALAFLREAVAVEQITPILIKHVRKFLKDLPVTGSGV
jgi:tetratricopeptide (TPR) repeat protein